MDEDTLFAELKKLDDWESFPIPSHWYAKYNIPLQTTIAPKEFMESKYTFIKSIEHKDLPALIIDEPQQDGKLVVPPPVEDIKVEVINRPFEWDSSKLFPAILPALKELSDPDKKD